MDPESMKCTSEIVATRLVNGASYAYMHPCGQCMPCRIRRREEWTGKILLESTRWNWNSFLTLTYSPDTLPQDRSVSVKEAQDFMKRLRINLQRTGRESVRYFIVGEYGEETWRPHYHAIIFNLPCTEESRTLVEKSWKKGFVSISALNPARARYAYMHPCGQCMPCRIRRPHGS